MKTNGSPTTYIPAPSVPPASSEISKPAPVYEYSITVLEYNTYGDRVVSRYPATILAANKDEVTDKVRVAFSATYDDFRKFWSHNWVLRTVTEITK